MAPETLDLVASPSNARVVRDLVGVHTPTLKLPPLSPTFITVGETMTQDEELFSGSRLDAYLESIKQQIMRSIERASAEDLSGSQKDVIGKYEKGRVSNLSESTLITSRGPPSKRANSTHLGYRTHSLEV
jgi:hypothetical protein